VRLEATITGRLGPLVQAKASAYVENTLVLHADLTLSGTAEVGPARRGEPNSRIHRERVSAPCDNKPRLGVRYGVPALAGSVLPLKAARRLTG